jgi:hypothetical protein
MPAIIVYFPGGGSQTFTEQTFLLEQALQTGTPYRPDGRPYRKEFRFGGWLLDGCPINRVLAGTYLPGQQDLLAANGIVCLLDIEQQAPPPPAPPPEPTAPPAGVDLVPVPEVRPIIVVPTGEPTTTVAATVVATVIAAVVGIFRRGVPKEIAQEIFGLRDAVVQLGRELLRLAKLLAAGIQVLLDALRTLWERVIKKLIDRVEQLSSKLGRLIDKVLGPYLDLLQKIRQIILDIYGRVFLPIIEMLQKIRQAIALLRILKVPGMKKLDEKLQQIQGKLIGVIQVLLQRANDHSGLLNVLLNVRMTLQHGTLLGSLYEARRSWISMWWNEQTPRPGSLAGGGGTSSPPEAVVEAAKRDMDVFARTGGGPLAGKIAPGLEVFRRSVQVPRRGAI